MPFVLIIAGTVLLISSVRNTYGQTTPQGGQGLGALLQSDFTGSANFVYWLVSLLIIGAVGYIPKLRPISIAFLTLVIIILFLERGNPKTAGGGFFQQFSTAISTTQQTSMQQSQVTAINQTLSGMNLTQLIPELPSIPQIQ